MKKPATRVLAALAAFLVIFFGVVWVKAQVVRTGYRVTELRDSLRALDLDLAQAEVALGALRHGARAQARGARLLLPSEYSPESVRYKKGE